MLISSHVKYVCFFFLKWEKKIALPSMPYPLTQCMRVHVQHYSTYVHINWILRIHLKTVVLFLFYFISFFPHIANTLKEFQIQFISWMTISIDGIEKRIIILLYMSLNRKYIAQRLRGLKKRIARMRRCKEIWAHINLYVILRKEKQ